MMMLLKIKRKSYCILNCLTSSIINCHRSVSTQSNIDLGLQMKQFNEKKQYKRTLSLLDANKQNEMSNFAINQALQACIHLRDFDRGWSIYEQLSSHSLNCRYIQTSLVQLHSKFLSTFSRKRRTYLTVLARRGDVTLAQRIVSSVPPEQRTPSLYTAMINGIRYFSFHSRLHVIVIEFI
jgi:hypothetical protein